MATPRPRIGGSRIRIAAMSSRVMMIGLDAGSLDFIEASLSSLPNLRRAVESGVRRRLRS